MLTKKTSNPFTGTQPTLTLTKPGTSAPPSSPVPDVFADVIAASKTGAAALEADGTKTEAKGDLGTVQLELQLLQTNIPNLE